MFFLDLFNPCIKSLWYDVFQGVFLKRFILIFSRVYSDIRVSVSEMKISWSWASSLGGSIIWISPLAWRKAQDLISSPDHLAVDVMIQAIPRNRPICALLNQICSLLSTSTSISLRLNSLGLLLPLETFNTEDIFVCTSFCLKIFLYLVTRHKRPIFMRTIFLSVFFSRLLTCTRRCQMWNAGKNSICNFKYIETSYIRIESYKLAS